MIRKIDPNTRRILKFPAVRPCESISSATLLDSLITLSHTITNYKSKLNPTLKKITREVIRQVEILRIFFEEIQDCVSKFTNSLTLCFSELHFAFQKILFLLQDCTHEGSRLYILMKLHFVASQFRVLIRSIAISIEIVRLNSLEVSFEVKELVELLSKQAQKAKLEPDPVDQCAMERVVLILNRFENGFEPERGLIKRVLDHLVISNWEDCNKEVIFLEEEMSNCEEERETPLFFGLLGFMCYCRGVVFETFDEDQQQLPKWVPLRRGEMFNWLNPHDFRCSISLELMMDPVTISTGQTYDRISIQKWLKSGELLCPKTGEKLKTTELVQNSALKRLIHQFCLDNQISISKSRTETRDLPRLIVSPTRSSTKAMTFLAQFLAARLTYGTDEQKNKAAYEIRLLTKSSISNRSIVIEYGNVPPLLDLLTSNDAKTQENAIAAILKISKHSKGQKAIIEEGGLMLVVAVLRKEVKIESRQIAAATIFYLSSVDRYRRLIGWTREVIPALVNLIKDGTMFGKKNSLAAICRLLVYQGNHQRALEAGIVPMVLDLIGSTDRSVILADALPVLASLAEYNDGSIAILQNSGLSLVSGVLKSSSSQFGNEYCVSILRSLCIHGGNEVVGILAKEPSLMPSIYSLVTQGSANGSKKARTLINMVQRFRESSSSNLVSVFKPKSLTESHA